MKASELGEFGLIERLAAALAAQAGVEPAGRLAVGIGDDAAVWRANGNAVVATTDTLVAGVHFLEGKTQARDLGWKALAVNVSDVAAMGGVPEFALATLGLPSDAEVDDIDELYRGLAEAGDAYQVVIAGGDIVNAPTLMVTVALAGRADLDEAGEPSVLRRGAAQMGDLIAVTGSLGGSAGGLRVLRDGVEESETSRALIARHRRPQARVEAGRVAVAAGVRCAIDVSDGLLQDIGHVCQASRLGAVVWSDKLPLDSALASVFERDEAIRFAAAGGEDYELVLTGAQEQLDAVAARIDVPLTVVGEMVIQEAHRASLLDESAREIELPAAGWEHLRG
jgi:thiamine-monophosphate kinase